MLEPQSNNIGKVETYGAIDAISASDNITKVKPMKVQMYDQINPAGPPSTSPW